jgi:hypothetical protein
MLFGSNPDTKELIITLLSSASFDSLDLYDQIKKKKPVTKQGFYKALRELLKDEVVTKNKRRVLLSPVWSNKLKSFVNQIEQTSTVQGSKEIINLQEGDTMVFRFKSIVELYLLWTHYFILFCKRSDGPVVFFNTHNFWVLIRSDIENEMYQWIRDNKKDAYSVIGHSTPLDRSTSDYIRTAYGIKLAYESKPSIREVVFPAVFGDFVMSTILDPVTVSAINDLYVRYSKREPALEMEILAIISRMKKPKMIIERNSKKAEKIRKKLLNHFIFYK